MKNIFARMTFSKRILYILALALGVIIFATFILCAAFRDLSPLQYIIMGMFSLCDISVGFYYWKAKAENIRKYDAKRDIQHIADEVEDKIKTYEVKRHG